ncbi:MAG: DegT/DnrJ/EryC1/StrS family aminotransferase [Spirulina sp.]
MIPVPYLNLLGIHRDRDRLLAAIASVIDSGWYILGQEVAEFEAEFAAFCQAEYCIGTGNGLDALRLMLLAGDIGEGDEVIVSANTYIATILAITQIGAIPILVEPCWETLQIDSDRIGEKISDRTKAILAVHLYGQPAPMHDLEAIARQYNLLLFDDCAQAHGAKIRDRPVGSWGDASAFSFFPTKNLGCLGDGGAVVTSNTQIAKKVKLLRNYGSGRKYYNQLAGWNSRLDEIQAAILRQRLPELEAQNVERRRLAERYAENLRDLPIYLLPYNANAVYHIFPILVEERDRLQEFLKDAEIGTLIHYPLPAHQQECYRDRPWAQLSLPLTEKIAREELSLPLYPSLTHKQQDYVIDRIKTFYEQR